MPNEIELNLKLQGVTLAPRTDKEINDLIAQAGVGLTTAQIQDLVSLMFAGTHVNASTSFDAVTRQITITAGGGGGSQLKQEEVEDMVGALIAAGTHSVVVPTYDDAGNALSFTVDAAALKIAYESEADTNAFTDALKSKLEAITANNYLGTFVDFASLPVTGVAGDYADVDSIAVGQDVSRYIWDVNDTKWVQQIGQSTTQIQADWTQLDTLSVDFIKNKPPDIAPTIFDPIKSVLDQTALGTLNTDFFMIGDSLVSGDEGAGHLIIKELLGLGNVTYNNWATPATTLNDFMTDGTSKNLTTLTAAVAALPAATIKIAAIQHGVNDVIVDAAGFSAEISAAVDALVALGIDHVILLPPYYWTRQVDGDATKIVTIEAAYALTAAAKNIPVIYSSAETQLMHVDTGDGTGSGINYQGVADRVHGNTQMNRRWAYNWLSKFLSEITIPKYLICASNSTPNIANPTVNQGISESGEYNIATGAEVVNVLKLRGKLTDLVNNQVLLVDYVQTAVTTPEFLFMKDGVFQVRLFGANIGDTRYKLAIPEDMDEVRVNYRNADLGTTPTIYYHKNITSIVSIGALVRNLDIRNYHCLDPNGITPTVTIPTVNPPTATDDSGFTTANNVPLIISDITANDIPVTGVFDLTSIILIDPANALNTATAGNTLTIPTVGDFALHATDGSVTYTPDLAYTTTGEENLVDYTVQDGAQISNIGNILIEVTAGAATGTTYVPGDGVTTWDNTSAAITTGNGTILKAGATTWGEGSNISKKVLAGEDFDLNYKVTAIAGGGGCQVGLNIGTTHTFGSFTYRIYVVETGGNFQISTFDDPAVSAGTLNAGELTTPINVLTMKRRSGVISYEIDGINLSTAPTANNGEFFIDVDIRRATSLIDFELIIY